MYEYKIIKPESVWNQKDKTFEELFNKHSSQGWRVINVAFNQSGNFTKAVLERNKNRI